MRGLCGRPHAVHMRLVCLPIIFPSFQKTYSSVHTRMLDVHRTYVYVIVTAIRAYISECAVGAETIIVQFIQFRITHHTCKTMCV